MSVHIRVRITGDGRRRYQVRYRAGGRYRPVMGAGTFATRREAETRRALVAGWLAAGLDPRTELERAAEQERSLADLADGWLTSRRDLAPRTLDAYRNAAARVVHDLGDIPVEALTWQRVNRWVGGLGLAAGTVRQHVGVLRMILDHADAANVARDRRVRLPRSRRRQLDPPDAPQVEAMLRRLHPRYRMLVALLERSGLRVSEALSLTPDDVEDERVRVRADVSKTGVARWAPKPEWLEPRVPFGVARQQVFNHMRAAQDLAGVHRFGPHMLRHRRATLWHQQRVLVPEAAAWLGHNPYEYLTTYSHVRRLSEVPDEVMVIVLSA